MKEFERKFSYPSLHLQGELEGYCPVQGYGTVLGHAFYFRARYEEWSFAISQHPEVDPVDIQLPETAEQYGFLRQGLVGKEGDYAASYMELAEAENLIVACSKEYLSTKMPPEVA